MRISAPAYDTSRVLSLAISPSNSDDFNLRLDLHDDGSSSNSGGKGYYPIVIGCNTGSSVDGTSGIHGISDFYSHIDQDSVHVFSKSQHESIPRPLAYGSVEPPFYANRDFVDRAVASRRLPTLCPSGMAPALTFSSYRVPNYHHGLSNNFGGSKAASVYPSNGNHTRPDLGFQNSLPYDSTNSSLSNIYSISCHTDAFVFSLAQNVARDRIRGSDDPSYQFTHDSGIEIYTNADECWRQDSYTSASGAGEYIKSEI